MEGYAGKRRILCEYGGWNFEESATGFYYQKGIEDISVVRVHPIYWME